MEKKLKKKKIAFHTIDSIINKFNFDLSVIAKMTITNWNSTILQFTDKNIAFDWVEDQRHSTLFP